ncbi:MULTISPECIES: hypothetical protein [unclassified Nocardioides]|uniref:hypothetical protein n=1 Tax=unclassified Nocardioides TaxID=2615069 RepID=UPI00361F10F2
MLGGKYNTTFHLRSHGHASSRSDRGTPRILAILTRLGALLLVSLGLVAVGGSPASAHTASVDASCEQLTVDLTRYVASGGPNTVRVVVDGETRAETTFGSSYGQAFALGDAATPHSWTVSVTAWDDPDGARGWTFERSGTSSPCEPPDACPEMPDDQPPGTDCAQPPDDVEHRWLHGAPDCTTHTITKTKQSRFRSYSWNGTAWTAGPWSEWTTVETKAWPTSPEQCPGTQVTATAPGYSPPDCATGPSLTHADGPGYHWESSGPPEALVLTAVADAGHTLVGRTVFGPYDTTPWTDEEKVRHGCVAPLADPVVTPAASCGVPAAITPMSGDHVAYSISGGSWSGLAAGDYVITATLTDGAVAFDNAAASGWRVDGSTATRVVTVAAPATCVTPDVGITSGVCVPGPDAAATGGGIVVPVQQGVTYVTRDAAGSVVDPRTLGSLAPGTYTVTATPADGYQVTDANGFVDGVRTVVIEPVGTGCQPVAVPVQPTVRAVDPCYSANDRVVFDRENEYWTAEITDDSHVTFTAKGDTLLEDRDGNLADRLVLSYPPLTDEQCPLEPGGVDATCVDTVPYLSYAVDLPAGFATDDPRPLRITFVNPDGPDHVVRDLPLTGRLLWPGASATEPLMWPGWDLVDGRYVDVGDRNFGWTRGGITVSFDVNPHYATSVTYPPATVACANPQQPERPPGLNRPPATTAPPLPDAGGPSGLLAALAGLLLVSGCALVRIGRGDA